ncbi:MAG TPA: hypothetical protein QGF58_01975 [Myxococcota bacterium]|nr:hypothetical protein [Myxococcota bacterium]
MITFLIACSQSCPEGGVDPARQAGLEAMGEPLGEVCFGDRNVLIGEVIVFDAAWDDPSLVAKGEHLLAHRAMSEPEPGSPECLESWIAYETEGWTRELERRRGLGLPAIYPFEAGWRDSTVSIRDWLVEHPEGGSGVDPLLASYEERCKE